MADGGLERGATGAPRAVLRRGGHSRPENTNALLALRFRALLGEGGAYVLEVAGALIR
jgi:hypothetical protein